MGRLQDKATKVTLVLVVDRVANAVLLGMKKRGFGEGKWNGFGGKVRLGEPPMNAAVRELYEEAHLHVERRDLKEAGTILFSFVGVPKFRCFVYITERWQGEPRETAEMSPEWFPINGLPLGQMWAADKVWMPRVLAGECIEGRVSFDAEGKQVLSCEIKSANT